MKKISVAALIILFVTIILVACGEKEESSLNKGSKAQTIKTIFKGTPDRPSLLIYDAIKLGNDEQVSAHFYYKTATLDGEPAGDNIPLLFVAVSMNHPHIVKQLLSYGADPNRIVDTHYIAIGKLNEYKIPLNKINGKITLLSLAIEKGNIDIARMLLDNGANPDPDPDLNVNRPFDIAVAFNSYDATKLLLERGVRPQYLHLVNAVNKHYYKIVELLINSGMDKRMMKQPLINAIKSNDKQMVDLLINLGADPTGKIRLIDSDREGIENKFMRAISEDDYEYVKQSIKEGIDVNLTDDEFHTVVYRAVNSIAVKSNKADILKLLIDAGADVNLGSSSPLHIASPNGHSNIVKILIDAGADVNLKDSEGKTPLRRTQDYISIVDRQYRYSRDWDGVMELLRKHGGK